MDDFVKQVVAFKLKRMFKEEKFFDICTVTDIIKTLNLIPNKQELEALRFVALCSLV